MWDKSIGKMADLLFTNPNLFQWCYEENVKQLAKWGIQELTPFEWLTITVEEIGELAKAICEYAYRGGSAHDVQAEAIQAATLCLKIAEMFELIKIKEGNLCQVQIIK